MGLNNFILTCEKDNEKLRKDINYYKNMTSRLKKENQELKKQLEDANEKIILLQASEPMLNYKKALEENQQKEFIKYLENKIKKLENNHEHMVIDMFGSYDLNALDLNILKEILQKYKSIIGEDK